MTAKAAGADCRAVSEILSRVGDKWTIQVVVALRSGSQRFNGIKRRVGGISRQQWIKRLDLFQETDRRGGVDTQDFDHPGLASLKIDRAVNVDALTPLRHMFLLCSHNEGSHGAAFPSICGSQSFATR
jgi:hypothetical protein